MLWQSVTLDGYIPFSHVGNTHVKIDFSAPCTAFLGTNGSGKSSLLRSLSVQPACRTDYGKNGKIVKTISHDGHVYDLTSDFSNATAPHSFKRDGVELNLSGTTDTQKDLIVDHFGITPLMEDILSGNIHICSAQKAFRKTLISSCYPSDLTFILEYHKKVCSQIRAYGNQIKLLQQREGALTASLIDPNERIRMEQFRDGANALIDRIDKVNILLEAEVNRLEDMPFMRSSVESINLDEAKYKLLTLRALFCHHFLIPHGTLAQLPEITEAEIRAKHAELATELKHATDIKNSLYDRNQSIRDELDKFMRLKSASEEDKKSELTKQAELIQKDIANLLENGKPPKDTSIPKNALDRLEYCMPRISDSLTSLHSYAGSMMTQTQVNELVHKKSIAEAEIGNINGEKSMLEGQLAKLKERHDKLTAHGYPVDCVRACGLRETVASAIRDNELHTSEIRTRVDELNIHAKIAQEVIDKTNSVLQESTPALPLISELERLLAENYLTESVLNGESLVDCLNTKCTEIYNRIVRAIEEAKKYYQYLDLKNKYDSIYNSIKMSECTEAAKFSADVIADLIRTKQEQLEEGIAQLYQLDEMYKQIKDRTWEYEELADTYSKVSKTIEAINLSLNRLIVRTRIEFDRKMIFEHCQIKNQLNARLRDIDRVLDEQKRTSDILNTEIKPTLNDLKSKKSNWELVEKGLSPTKGLPCIYLIRFMNRLFALANAYIKEVWCHDMELVYLSEDEDLDFTIQVMQNKATIVKDISLCSKGEQAMIDLAFTLAICVERNWLKHYPLSLDEVDGALTESHRAKLVALISRMLDDETISQLFLVNHFAIQTGISKCDSVVLATDDIILPSVYNTNVEIN